MEVFRPAKIDNNTFFRRLFASNPNDFVDGVRGDGVCLFCDDGPEAGRMKPELVLNDVKRPIVVEVSAEVKRS
jgi:hypothetical protein